MRTRVAPNCRVRQIATPDSPRCSVGSSVDQSVVPNGISINCTTPPVELLTLRDAFARLRKIGCDVAYRTFYVIVFFTDRGDIVERFLRGSPSLQTRDDPC